MWVLWIRILSAGKDEEGSNVWYLSDLFTTAKLKEHNNEKVTLDTNHGNDLLAFDGTGARKQIKAQLTNGYRQLANGNYYNRSEIALGYNGTKFGKGLGVIPAPEGEADKFIVYSTSSLNVDRFYAVVGGTGHEVTNPGTENAYVTFEVYGCAADSYTSAAEMQWTKLAYAENIRSYVVAEFNVDITGYRYIKLVVKMSEKTNLVDATSGANISTGCEVAWGDACFYSSTGAPKSDFYEPIGKDAQLAGLKGMDENAKNVQFLGNLMSDKKYYVDHYGTNVANANYNGDLIAFENGGRKQIKAKLESEVLLYVSFTLENLNGVDAATLTGKVGVLVWDMNEFTALGEENATYANCNRIATEIEYLGNNKFEATTDGIPAKKLGDALAFRAYYVREDGTYVYGRIVQNYSPRKYCYNGMGASETFDNLLIAILNYGAAAQKFFGWRTDDLMNSQLNPEQQTINWNDGLVRSDWTVPAAKEGELTRNKTVVAGRGATVSLEGAIDYEFTITVSENIQIKSVKILPWSENLYNSLDVLTAGNAEGIYDMEYIGENKYVYVSKEHPAKTMFQAVYTCAVVEDMDGNIYYGGVVGYCPERYTYLSLSNSNADLVHLAKCMAIYGDAARKYFG